MLWKKRKAFASEDGGQITMLHILICDDEPAAAADLEQRVRAQPDFSERTMQICCLTQPDEMLAADLTVYDLLFLDIDMGEVNGIDLARRLRRTRPDAVLIFVTNFIEYAPEGYEVNAFRYLSKQQLELLLPAYFADALAVCRTRQRTVDIFCEGEITPVVVQSIIYAESIRHEQLLHLNRAANNTLSTRMTMANLEELLAPHGFLRIHRSFLVNMAFLRQLQSTEAELTGVGILPVSARSYREMKRKYLNWVVRQE